MEERNARALAAKGVILTAKELAKIKHESFREGMRTVELLVESVLAGDPVPKGAPNYLRELAWVVERAYRHEG